MKPSDIRILAVDDDEMILEVIADLFKSFQFKVDTAKSGNSAWELSQRHNYTIVITDIRMPNGDGLELVRKLNSHPSKPSTLVISGFSDMLNEEIYHLGVEGIFSKPFDAAAVRSAIKTCLLAPESRWDVPVESGKLLELKKTGSCVEDFENDKSLIFGRGGFFISYNHLAPQRGKKISFNIEISKPRPLVFSGIGIIRWIQLHGKVNSPAGLGIEIVSMPSNQAIEYQKLFGHIKPFIPSPRKMKND